MTVNDFDEQLAVSVEQVGGNLRMIQKQRQEDCPLCLQPVPQILINNALYHKYLDTHLTNDAKHTDNIIDNALAPSAVLFREMAVVDQDQQFMRRMYGLHEYDNKNKAIVEYYKFHRDYPKIHVTGVANIMETYADRKKEFQYKRIKRILKQEENISITTQKSSQIFSDIEQEDKRSNFSNVLKDLTQSSLLIGEENNQSQVFKFMCKKIDQAFQNQPLSPINFNKKSIFDQAENNQAAQTNNFVSYLRKQQQKREKQQKFKNFIRSNKQSRYNSIEHENKQYSSGGPSASNSIKNHNRITGQRPVALLKGPNAFYDGRLFYSSSNNKGNPGSMSKEQRTKEQTNLPSQQFVEFDYFFAQNGFKKQKETSNNNLISKNQRTQGDKNYGNYATQRQRSHQFQTLNLKSKQTTKTTESIYKNATQQMGLKKKAFSYNSLANTNHSQKRSSATNPLKQKDFEIRNRISSQRQHLQSKEKNGLFSNKGSLASANSQSKVKKSSSVSNFKTSRSIPKFYNQADRHTETIERKSESTAKKISIPKDMIKTLKGKSNSSAKLNIGPESSRPGNYFQKQTAKQAKKDINLFVDNEIKNKFSSNNLMYTHQTNRNVDVNNLLHKKLLISQGPKKSKQPKILI